MKNNLTEKAYYSVMYLVTSAALLIASSRCGASKGSITTAAPVVTLNVATHEPSGQRVDMKSSIAAATPVVVLDVTATGGASRGFPTALPCLQEKFPPLCDIVPDRTRVSGVVERLGYPRRISGLGGNCELWRYDWSGHSMNVELCGYSNNKTVKRVSYGPASFTLGEAVDQYGTPIVWFRVFLDRLELLAGTTEPTNLAYDDSELFWPDKGMIVLGVGIPPYRRDTLAEMIYYFKPSSMESIQKWYARLDVYDKAIVWPGFNQEADTTPPSAPTPKPTP